MKETNKRIQNYTTCILTALITVKIRKIYLQFGNHKLLTRFAQATLFLCAEFLNCDNDPKSREKLETKEL
jgi:hypothetical protein